MAQRINQTGLDMIKTSEGLALEAYLDPVGIWTIGYGHIEGVVDGMVITEEEAEALLLEELVKFETGVTNAVKTPLNENEFAALVSFSYNVGLGALEGSTALKRLNKGDRLGAANALEWWNKGRVNGKLVELLGLTRRRAKEKAIFLEPVVTASISPTLTSHIATTLEEDTRFSAAEENEPRRDDLSESRTMQAAAATAAVGAISAAGIAANQTDPTTIENRSLRTVVEFFSDLPPETYYVLGGIIIFLGLYIMYSRWDDWRNFRR